jgi:diguanylate cyclase (GGDEF)-like protein
VPQLTQSQARLINQSLDQLRSFLLHWRIEPLRRLVPFGGVPDEVTSLVQKCDAIEREVTAWLSSGDPAPPVLVDDQESSLLKLAILNNRKHLAASIAKQKRHAVHAQIIDTLDSQLKPYDDLMCEDWFENTPTEKMPQLTDFVSLEAAIEGQKGRVIFEERQFDEKFHLLQAPDLLQADLAYYRENCALRGSSLAVAYLDIDNFKQKFNSQYGETVVDRNVLPRFMMAIEAFVFGRGQAYRYGGDEYGVILPGLGQTAAEDALDELRLRVKELEYFGVQEKTSVSIGLCVVDPGCFLTNHEIEHMAEQAKNEAKKSGRDRIAACLNSKSGWSFSIVRPREG